MVNFSAHVSARMMVSSPSNATRRHGMNMTFVTAGC
jgi:hypothetical protein